MPGGVADEDVVRAGEAIADASTRIRAFLGRDFIEDGEVAFDDDLQQDIVETVCLSVARRAFVNPDGATQESVPGFSQTLANASPDTYLTKQEKTDLLRSVGRSGLFTISTTRLSGDEVYDTEPNDPTRDIFPDPW